MRTLAWGRRNRTVVGPWLDTPAQSATNLQAQKRSPWRICSIFVLTVFAANVSHAGDMFTSAHFVRPGDGSRTIGTAAAPAVRTKLSGVARVRTVQGDAWLEAASSRLRARAPENAPPLRMNMPVSPEERVATGPDGRVELQLESGVFVRLGGGAVLDVEPVASPSDVPGDAFTLSRGRVQVDSSLLDDNGGTGAVTVMTPEGRIMSAGKAVYTVAVNARGDATRDAETSLHVIVGAAEVDWDHGRARAASGEALAHSRKAQAWQPISAAAGSDDPFDEWTTSMARAASDMQEHRHADTAAELSTFFGELSAAGTWRYSYKHDRSIWIPAVPAGWRPYTVGRWWPHRDNLTWTSYETWGWAPYHYGSWDFSPRLGWFWVPGAVYAPAHVEWVAGPDYVAWCPMRLSMITEAIINGWDNTDEFFYNLVYGDFPMNRYDPYLFWYLNPSFWITVPPGRLLNPCPGAWAYPGQVVSSLPPARVFSWADLKITDDPRPKRIEEKVRQAYHARDNERNAWLPTGDTPLRGNQRHSLTPVSDVRPGGLQAGNRQGPRPERPQAGEPPRHGETKRAPAGDSEKANRVDRAPGRERPEPKPSSPDARPAAQTPNRSPESGEPRGVGQDP